MVATEYQVVILGTGPAGLQAAIHAARRKVSVLVLGHWPKSSLFKAHVDNFCCLPSGKGEDILLMGRDQAEKSGAHFAEEDVMEINPLAEGGYKLKTESGNNIKTKALIMAMGISRNRLGIAGEKEFVGKGVSYCVDCDGGFYKNEKVTIIGGGSAAASGALTMLFIADEVHMVCRELEVTETLAEQIRKSEIILHEGAWPKVIKGENAVSQLELDNGESLLVTGVFIELGAKGAVELASTLGVALDSENFQYIETNKRAETNVSGIYAAGDITGPPWQVAKAVGEGCVAGIQAADYVKKAD
ncbi:NAD(P)/FAD-dependent oxidoreductase [Dethiosulfatarculus sandiegensis]|uniref:Thioredoxin reductase n=1 Tax=Dethiosulfatarculus sandiegensis TaxID=1429043 RepID=A0A0D2JYP7_9BACT|nr:FAD-dependent oxidoreductase [Dethiosulfatarculus sandiegensis]KIX14685.1 thioredoxin reductase [Dethiosulfatarculus sandiegensis]